MKVKAFTIFDYIKTFIKDKIKPAFQKIEPVSYGFVGLLGALLGYYLAGKIFEPLSYHSCFRLYEIVISFNVGLVFVFGYDSFKSS